VAEAFVMPRPTTETARDRELLATGTALNLDCGLAGTAWGKGPPVLLAHGWESRRSHWGAFVPALVQAGFSAVAIDAPAHGDSPGQRVNVLEYGKGIDAVTRDRLFDPFFTTKAPGKSTGIGLSYSLGIIQAHGGTITIEDAAEDADAFAGVGTVFVITLPIETSAEKSAATGSAMSAKAKGRALIIDDEEDVAETLADMLERMGMSTTMAVGGVAGQDAMADGAAFDLVLSDIRMPDCDGPTLYTWITANRPDLASRVAFVTGDTLSGIAADFLEQTRCPVLEKPFTPAGLRDLVAAMLPN
jgi:CheY-like chemotaxis protein